MPNLFGWKNVRLCVVASVCAVLAACGSSKFNDPPGIATSSIAKTQHPLVASYTVATALGCQGQVSVEFGTDTSYGRSTAWYPVPAFYQQTQILVAGMKASTTYHMRAQAQCLTNSESFTGTDATFTTGALPALAFPTLTVTRPNPSLSSIESPGIESIDSIAPDAPALFTDRDGNPIWYYDVGQGNYSFPFKLLPNGHMLINIGLPTETLLREVDLAGNTVREMDMIALQQKMAAVGTFDFVPGIFHHDFLPLANGHVILLVQLSKSFTDLPGYPGTIFVTGDALIDLDPNWNPVWSWNSFDYLDVNRHLNGLPDWTHSNALIYSPADGNLMLSMRHQSWILKIDYNNGTGTGNVLWKLGYQGDFELTDNGVPSADPSEWFSFQHYPILLKQNGAQSTLGIWDNGDNRVLNASTGEICADPRVGSSNPSCYSRPTIFAIDENAKVANLVWGDQDQLSYYGVWGGSINQMANGNVEFDLNAPALPPSPGVDSVVQEVTQTASPQIVWQMELGTPGFAYRAYRVLSLYNGVTWNY